MILLVGNYEQDRQQSMLRFCRTLETELGARGEKVQVIRPEPYLGRLSRNKWMGYVDKFLLFPLVLRQHIRRLKKLHPDLLLHICDHSNAPYVSAGRGLVPVVVTCHDMLAVRGAFGEETDCAASGMGKRLQRWILSGLKKADEVICVSGATRNDLLRLGGPAMEAKSGVIPNFQNYGYRRLAEEEIQKRLLPFPEINHPDGYLLHVGSNLLRKNRAAVLRIARLMADGWKGKIVFAGDIPDEPLWGLADHLGIRSQVVGLAKPDSALLEALYNGAYALVFPSRFEGFGWPVIEAQACGCPVVASNQTSIPEVVGEGGMIREVGDLEGFAGDLLRLGRPDIRQDLIRKGYANLGRFDTETVMGQYLEVYRKLSHP